MSDDDVLQAFEEHQRILGLAYRTRERRRYSLRKLKAFAAPVPLQMVNAELIWDWLSTYRKAETRHGYQADARAFYRWARKRGLVLLDPTEDMDRIRVPKHLPRPIAEAELALAIATARDTRLRLALVLAAFAGLRLSEVARLRGEDCSVQRIVVRDGKGSRDGVVPTHPIVWQALSEYGTEHGWLFPSPKGDAHVTRGTVAGWVREHFAELGIEGGLHRARHRYGTRLAEAARGDMLAVRDLMRHSEVKSSEGYVEYDTSRLGPIIRELPVAGA